MRKEQDRKLADPFRWTTFNFWTFVPAVGREGFVNRVTGGSLTAISPPDQDMGIQGNSDDARTILESWDNANAPIFKYGDIFRFLPNESGYSLMIDADPTTVTKYGCPLVRERFGFCLYNAAEDRYVSNDEKSMRDFLNLYVPDAIKNSRVNTTRRKLKFFKNILFYGKDSGNWWNWMVEGGAPDVTKEFYEEGILPPKSRQPAERKHPDWGRMQYRDYTFDAPGAFTREELDGMIMAPLHSAEITKKIGNVDTVNQKGYTSELQVPNIYFYYNALELEKDFKNKTKPEDDKSPANLASDYILKRYKMTPQETNEAEEDGFVKTGKVLKFTSDRVEKLEKINDFMKAYAENYVEINIGTVQGGPVQAIINQNNMDRLLLETIYPHRPANSTTVFERAFTHRIHPGTKLSVPKQAHEIYENSSMVLDDYFQGIKYSDPDRPGGSDVNVTLNDKVSHGVPIRIIEWFFTDILKRVGRGDGAGGVYQATDPMEWPLLYWGWDNAQLLRFEETIRSQITRTKIDEFIARGAVPTKIVAKDDKEDSPFGGIFRPVADVFTGKKAYSEVLGYCIKKFEIDEDEKEKLIQTFVLMDSNDIKEINFIDSQVLPFKKYRYSINTINFVLATEYSYGFAAPTEGAKQSIETISKPGMYIIEAPFFEKIIETRDAPPLAPQVSWLPYQGIDDKIGILLTTNYGEIEEPWLMHKAPFSKNFKEDTLEGKYGMNKKGLIKWKTDSMPDAFQIFRLENPPESYEWFHPKTGSRYVGPKRGPRMHTRIPSYGKVGFFLDTIEPNKYYYYMFRAIDNYDFEKPDKNKYMYSNPTEVFRVRMVSYENGIFLEMEPYEMFKKEEDEILNVERLLKISPSFDQKLINFSQEFKKIGKNLKIVENSLNSVRRDLGLFKGDKNAADSFLFQKNAPPAKHMKLGTHTEEKEIIWNKKFKIRIRSKSTGKAVDLNVKFVQSNNTLTKEE